jgi:hypothetical protein
VGFHVSDSEDEEALRQAYRAGVATAGSPPLATTLDNKPGNHSPGAEAALEGTILLAATPGRGQAKAALEGAFGLFRQSLPPLEIVGRTAREQARNALHLILTAWFRGRNGRPRKHLGGLSPAQAYAQANPTPDELQKALDWVRELQRRQKLARLTREARRDPVRIQLLTQGLAELGSPTRVSVSPWLSPAMLGRPSCRVWRSSAPSGSWGPCPREPTTGISAASSANGTSGSSWSGPRSISWSSASGSAI